MSFLNLISSGKLTSPRERFLKKVEKRDGFGCWLWLGFLSRSGYGQHNYKGSNWRAHRVAYDLFVGKIPDGLFVCHTCDVRNCVNPNHLFLGTHEENMRDMVKKGRASKTGVGKGRLAGEKNPKAKLTAEDVATIRATYRRYTNHGTTSIQLGKKFGVSPSTICRIVKQEGWRAV